MIPFIKPLWWENNKLYIIDQQKLPLEEKIIQLERVEEVFNAIKTLKIRGAPAIGCATAFGVAISAINTKVLDIKLFIEKIKEDMEFLSQARPTAYNLFFSLERMEKILREKNDLSVNLLREKIISEAEKIYQEDLKCSYLIGKNGAELIKDGMKIITYCNAGALATSGLGTALAPLYISKQNNVRFHVYVNETRPVLQGARLTAWELQKADIPYTLICDNMSGWIMQREKIDMVITGADRIAANGDTANKIGTYSLAVLAYYHKIPFYIAAPYSTFDKKVKSGQDIIIEERNPEEIKKIKNILISPKDASVYNPAFDITPAKLIKAFITENGIINKI